MLLLHGALILRSAYDKRSIFSVKQLNIKSGKWEKLLLSLIILEVNNEVVVKIGEKMYFGLHQYFFTRFRIFCTPLSFVDM